MAEPRNYTDTLNMPQTDFPMRAGLPKAEPEHVKRWQEDGLYKQLREDSKGRPKYVLHDGPPYANGNLHIGHALNKILKDIITRSFQMRGYDSNYVPGWDCHGLPIEWKIEEQYRANNRNKDDVPINEFRQQCREFAKKWVDIQSEEFLRLGVTGDFDNPYLTMNYQSEAIIADELMKFAKSGQLYRGSKPIMWSVVERTALAEAEIEYEIMESDTVWVKFPVVPRLVDTKVQPGKPVAQVDLSDPEMTGSTVVIWTTTPWTIPANRAVCFSQRVEYGNYMVMKAENDFGPQPGEYFVAAKACVNAMAEKAAIEVQWMGQVTAEKLANMVLMHPLRNMDVNGYDFLIPMLAGDHVTDEAGTGFVHTAPGHGRDDFEIFVNSREHIEALGIDASIPFCVDDGGYYTEDAPGFGPDTDKPARVIDDKGKKGDANQRVITALIGTNNLFARGRVKHEYPHSWRSKKPIIFRNTPQWFVHMDKEGVLGGAGSNHGTLRQTALAAIEETRFVPPRGEARLHGMIADRPDWVLSRQRAWGVPISVFRNEETGQVAPGPDFDSSDELAAKIKTAFAAEGADAWYAEGAKERFLSGFVDDLDGWQKVDDILDVWFDSGSTHAFCLQQRDDLKWPADLYLEGSDQHRGWFHSSLLESCGTRGRAPYDAVLTHGFVMAEDGTKMSKSKGNTVTPQDVIKQSGADILRLWVSSADYSEDLRLGKTILQTNIDAYRKLRNTLRWMLGTLAHDKGADVAHADMPELERLMLHRLSELDVVVREGYDAFDFKRIFAALSNFMNLELSAFYFDIRKDALYCDGDDSVRRQSAMRVVSHLFDCLVKWMAPMLAFTMEEAWLSRHPDGRSVHREQFPDIPAEWNQPELAARWKKVRSVRRVINGALEVERSLDKEDPRHIGKSLEAAPQVFIVDVDLLAAVEGLPMEDIAITSAIEIVQGEGPADAFRLNEVPGVAVVNRRAEGTRCARSWRVLPEVGSDPDYPDLSLRDAAVMRTIDAA
ncbi:isoleucine--tRNA ligase [Ahrensia sp. R2A130]|uniref:isoleucine--tRNA ligase n=1 Tax=Ahrensia sp. R2A130 TaxID=744979 RepID=UPI0001E09472|nr:isoleucine--tRNA ligase [Ahrensia sp. R2A130]EFL88559.1 isoleucine--tRNA ligase [Ahrensia sp. R2A130]